VQVEQAAREGYVSMLVASVLPQSVGRKLSQLRSRAVKEKRVV